MTISSNDRRKPYVGNGVADTFNGPRAFAASHVQVFTGEHPVYNLIPNSQYTITGVGGAATRVKFNTPPANGLDILLLRTVPYSQDTDITNQGAFNPEIHENAFDMRVMQIQQLADGSIQMVFEDGEFVWDAKGSRIVRVGDAVALPDAMNLQSVLALVEQIQSGGGVVGVNPTLWDWIGNGVDDGIPIPGAAVADPAFYDTALETGVGTNVYTVAKPGVDFTIEIADDTDDSILRMATAPADGIRGFTVLRGYARPWTGGQPITTTAPRIIDVDDDLTVDGTYHNSVLRVTSNVDVTVTIRENTGDPELDWQAGGYFEVLQNGAGKVVVVADGAGTIAAPTGFECETRAQASRISLLCEVALDSEWSAGGDVLRTVSQNELQAIIVAISDEATNLATGTGKATFRMPFPFILSGVRASLKEAQTAGSILTFDINRGGTSILATKLTVDNNEKTSVTAATPYVFQSGGDVLADDDEITFDIDQIGTAGAKGAKIALIGRRP